MKKQKASIDPVPFTGKAAAIVKDPTSYLAYEAIELTIENGIVIGIVKTTRAPDLIATPMAKVSQTVHRNKDQKL